MNFSTGDSWNFIGRVRIFDAEADADVTSFVGWTATSQLRLIERDQLVADFVVTINENGSFSHVFAGSTDEWPTGAIAAFDIRFLSPQNETVTTEATRLALSRPITR